MRRFLMTVTTLAVLATPAAALQNPELILAAGTTTAVSGDPGDGGLALSVSALWTLDPPFRAGLVLQADDCGTRLGRLRAAGTNADLGAVAVIHRSSWGGGWRFDAQLPALGRWQPFTSATLGLYRVQDDVRGTVRTATTSTGASLGGGVRRAFTGFGALGMSARWNRVERGPSNGWLSAGLDWQVKWGKRP
jgi:hypothetical protein